MNTRLKIFFCSLTFLISTNCLAQETLFTDLSYPYLEKLIAAAKANYPESKIKQDQINIAKSTFHQSNFGWLDAFNASYIYSPQTTLNLSTPTTFKGYQLTATVNLGLLFERPYTIHNARENLKIAELQKDEYLLTLEAQVKHAYFAYIAAQTALRNHANAVLDASTAVKQLKHTFEKGETTFEVYNASLANLYNQTTFKVQAELAVFSAKTDLEQWIGARLESIK